MTTTTNTLTSLKNQIKDIASESRSIRDEARTLSGLDRYNLQRTADACAGQARTFQLACGYLRNRTISQMQSEFTENFPWGLEKSVSTVALKHFRPRAENESDRDYEKAQVDLAEFIKNDIKQFKATCKLNRLTREARLRKAA